MYVVTGGAGFIGSHLVHRLVHLDEEVTVIDNLFSGNLENLVKIKDKIKFRQDDSGKIASYVDEKPEVIFHQGVYSSSPMYKENPILTAKAIEDFIGILEFARKKDCKVVYASSSSVYSGIEPPHKEDAKILVTDYYTVARQSMERVAILYNKLYGTSVIGLRYFSVYGENEKFKGKYANLISQFLWSAMKSESPLVFGDGEQSRDFTYVEDVVNANLLAQKCNEKLGVFNVGTGKETKINEMIDIIGKKLEKEIKPQYKENPIKNYVSRTQADTSLAKEKMSFVAQVTLEEGIGKLVELYKGQ